MIRQLNFILPVEQSKRNQNPVIVKHRELIHEAAIEA